MGKLSSELYIKTKADEVLQQDMIFIRLENSNENLALVGKLSLARNVISALSGQFTTKEGAYVGAFFYNEDSEGKCSRSITDLMNEYSIEAALLLDATIEEIKDLSNE